MSTSPILSLRRVRKSFGSFTAVDGVDLDIGDGEFFTIVGPSGSGKTTLLRMLAGLDTPSDGDILLKGVRVNDVPANKRPTCLVFQSLALFPHKSVGDNIGFSLKIRGIGAAQRKARALELMRLLRLPETYYSKNVMKCSGGERQRVALARALAFDPEILFFDEPLSAIDYKLRKTLEKELKDLHKETGKTFVYITHSLEEAMVMSDRIGVMRAGKLVQVGSPNEIYTAPTTRFVSEFIGDVNVIPVKRAADGMLEAPALGARFAAPASGPSLAEGHLVIRPEFLRFLGSREEAANSLSGQVYNEYALGSRIQYQVRVGEQVFIVERLRQQPFGGQIDDAVIIGWDPADAILVGD
ncbi:spermidine/putrescine transport system ATP-binding protein [Rhodoligotrophos appendicifer]|uniref:ABC transporter ATP-binding protein n=1 Tax=Rhodoligotrophos appendicifer TaxID=987056 RepID=UPI0011810DCA|nr:ABC transporter ATP-binding protein [Rhodoligotrophos appendicifer]